MCRGRPARSTRETSLAPRSHRRRSAIAPLPRYTSRRSRLLEHPCRRRHSWRQRPRVSAGREDTRLGKRPDRLLIRPMRAFAIAGMVIAVESIPTATPTAAAPFIPANDNLVLETGLPNIDPRTREMRALANRLRDHPDDLATAMLLASRQLAMGLAEADPRFIGYARGTLTRWWRDDAVTPQLRILRARILQAQHDFALAAADLRA